MPLLGFLQPIGSPDPTATRELRFGCHYFLNARIFTYPITQGLVEFPFKLELGPPAELADMLLGGELDMAFIPAIEYARADKLRIVPGFGIASLGEVKTVVMFSRYELDTVKKITLDNRSRTSVALLKILLKDYFKRDVEFAAPSPDVGLLEGSTDAALLIGDETFDINPTDYNLYDLSKAWHEFTGKPFVFALLCVAEGVNADSAIAALHHAKVKGLEKLDELCRTASIELEIDESFCKDYLTNCMRYELDNSDIEGLELFFKMAHKNGLIENNPKLNFYK
ncbi:MAG: menaquinone biosynthetic enzyme MqnA/MqnD family protein [Nitrospinota bacterium]